MLTRDEGVSGTVSAGDRPGLALALTTITDQRADGLVVSRLDRLARTLAVQEAALAHVWRHGGKVFAADVGEILTDDPDDPMRTAVRQVMGVFGQLERSMITARLRAGRRLKAEVGGFAYGSPSFGYRAEKGELVPDQSEQHALNRIAELHAQGASLRTICSTLNDEGFPTKRGTLWSPGSLGRIVKRMDADNGAL